ncbi:MAG: DUF444 family protein [Vicinamibacterales bacterium]
MTVLRDPGSFHDDGRRDARRYHQRLHRAIAEQLKSQIGDEQLITAGPERRVTVRVRGQRAWRFVFQQPGGPGVGQGGDPGDRNDPGADHGAAGPGAGGPGGDGGGTDTYEVVLDMVEVEQHLFEQLGLPRLAPKPRQQEETESTTWDERARRGALLDKRATLRNTFRRNAASGRPGIGGIEPEDLRYRSYREQRRPATKAVVFLLLDVSGSMGGFEKRVARLFFWWATRFLRHRYHSVELVFIAHHDSARECTEEEFFTRMVSGGTRCSSAYRLALDVQRARYPLDEWNVFVTHCSDGDNQADDDGALLELVRETAAIANLVGYVQIDRTQRYPWGGHGVLDLLEEAAIDGVVTAAVTSDDEIWAALRRIFRPEADELAS